MGVRKTTEQFKEELAIKNPNIEVLGEYMGNAKKILVKDKRCGHEWDTSVPQHLLAGGGCPECGKITRGKNRRNKNKIGEINTMCNGEIAEIVDYNGNMKVLIKFKSTNETVECTYAHFVQGKVKSHFTPTVFNIGVTGIEKTRDENNKLLIPYKHWSHMLERCYSEYRFKKYPTYIGCTVCDEWLFYPNFKKWYDENYYTINDEIMCLDKDILYKGNKVYSPDTCVFVPHRINLLFTKRDKTRGDLPIGVHYGTNKKYIASCSVINTSINKPVSNNLGTFYTMDDAFYLGYKPFKENYIKQIAEEYKNKIPVKLYNAMYNWKVEITD